MPSPEKQNTNEVHAEVQKDLKESKAYVPVKDKISADFDQSEFEEKKAAEKRMLSNQMEGMTQDQQIKYIENRIVTLKSDQENSDNSAEISALLDYVNTNITDADLNNTDISKYISFRGYFESKLAQYKVLMGVPVVLADRFIDNK